ncbi:aldehyde dehydrogenase family protein [Plantactinospora sp. B6F1]|uniref:aldehyde dehydrogenase family protein n=1 Tax=Plantactinospora sp. B6F1 TaxID=3158971 RepID=UPI0032D9A9B2
MRSYSLYIDGNDVSTGRWIHTIRASALLTDAFSALTLKRSLDRGGEADPDDARVVGRVAYASPEQCLPALAAARRAQPIWARVPFAERLAFGAAIHDDLRARATEFVDILVAEGHPRRLAEWEVAGVLEGSSPESLQVSAELMVRTRRVGQREVRLVRKPDGVLCVHPPRNASASNSVLGMPALIAGNSVVVKAPRSSPLGVAWFWREIVAPALDRFGAPPGTLNLICAEPKPVLEQWLDSPDVDDVMFIGDSNRGIEFGKRCVERGKKPILELAGNDGVLVWKDADLESAARALTECFYGSAQICMVPKYALVHPAVADELLDRLRKWLPEIRPGLPEEPDVLLTPVLRTGEFFTVLDEARKAGAELVAGGERMDQDGVPSPTGLFLQPTVIRVDGLDRARELRAVQAETFYPLLPIVVLDDGAIDAAEPDDAMFDRAVGFLNRNTYGLRNSLWSEDPDRIDQFCERVVNGGLLKVNDSHLGFVPGLPTHGGTGLTGGPFGECNLPMIRSSHLQGISIATEVRPRDSVFTHLRQSAAAPQAGGVPVDAVRPGGFVEAGA